MIPMINIIVLFMLFLSKEVKAQTSAEAQKETQKLDFLKIEITKMDSLLFDVAFNQCDAGLFKKIISDDVEFYDDRFGLNISKANEIKSLIGKCDRSDKLTRKLNSCTIDKLGDFGAVQIGEHTFYVDGIPEGTGKFIHIWERKDNDWKLKRIVSYEHRPIKE
ncbi:nuclear transport factor 2 family protein [Flavobacterium sp. JLP]|uniref:nuclear transport factor 2 family protein n=2 Tax=unclassified Flavobacterium TaxID=196869 RepID=UPI00188BD96F|nr:nuclear transport factor 2 family protein [Flavobacterium sp. JLP]MBF4493841.1 nuclear transport factor 2 family protein [Flavobacterium sp. MR2016-29]MBF4508356.1 nuclear transport factor 2 family protein [Flavobacterium sp. JLP]